MRHVWSVLASKAIVDKQTNMISMIDSVDRLNIDGSGLPAVDPKAKENIILGGISLSLVTMWFRSDYNEIDKGLSRVSIVTPDGKRFIQPERETDLKSASTVREILVIDKLIYRGDGLYWFRVEQKKENLKRWTLEAEIPLLVACDDGLQAGSAA